MTPPSVAARVRALAQRSGDTGDEAIALAEEALAHDTGVSGVSERAQLLLALAAVRNGRGEYTAALRAAVDAGELARQAGDAAGQCDALVATAGTLRAAGDHGSAISLLEQAEPLARAVADPLRVARVLRSLGVVASLLGRHQHALSCLAEAVDLVRQHAPDSDDALAVQQSLLNAMSRRLPALDDPALAADEGARLLHGYAALADDCRRAASQRTELMAIGNHAIQLTQLGRHTEAAASLQALVPRYRALGMRPNEGLAHAELGNCHERLGDPATAREHFGAAVTLLREGGAQDDLLPALEGLARCEEALGEPGRALQALKTLREIERKRSDTAARQAITMRELRIELARLSSQWARQAVQDPLTGLANRRALDRWFEERWPAVEQGRGLALLLLDLDHFKQVNDRHGHGIGDDVLKAAARLLQAHGRASDLAVRYGGEEFLLAMDGADRHGAETLAERLRAAMAAHPWGTVAAGLAVTVSIGVAEATEALNATALLTLADRRLYAAKLGGRNRVVAEG